MDWTRDLLRRQEINIDRLIHLSSTKSIRKNDRILFLLEDVSFKRTLVNRSISEQMCLFRMTFLYKTKIFWFLFDRLHQNDIVYVCCYLLVVWRKWQNEFDSKIFKNFLLIRYKMCCSNKIFFSKFEIELKVWTGNWSLSMSIWHWSRKQRWSICQ